MFRPILAINMTLLTDGPLPHVRNIPKWYRCVIVQRLLEKIQNSSNVPIYDYVFFDCPPSFSLLSYSVLSCCNLILIPINPDFFAAKGLDLLLSSLRMRIEPFPVPRIGVFMNRARKPGGSSVKRFSNETQRYLNDAAEVLDRVATERGLKVR